MAEIFGFAPNEFRRIRASHFAPELTDPYVILGLSYVADEDETHARPIAAWCARTIPTA